MSYENTAQAIIQAHIADALRGYQGNLQCVLMAVRNGWIPTGDDDNLQQHLATLQQYLEEQGKPENDDFLLRYGLTVSGTQRGIEPPYLVLHPNRGGFPVRRRREAQGQIERLREALALGRNFLPQLSQTTQQAIVELADWIQLQPKRDSDDWLTWFVQLQRQHADELTQTALQWLATPNEQIREMATEILEQLACLSALPLGDRCWQALLDQACFLPASLYRPAGETIAERLLQRIDPSFDTLQLDRLLLALAWTRSRTAEAAFVEWRVTAPAWQEKLFISPEEYAPSAGWCLNDSGERRDLISLACYRLELQESTSQGEIPCNVPLQEPCPDCGRNLTQLFDFTALGPAHFQGEWAEAPRHIVYCAECCYGSGFTISYRRDLRGTDGKRNRAKARCFRRAIACPAFACASASGLTDTSTIGGIPAWVQDAAFPHCMECGQLMNFLAQQDNGSLGEEGSLYAFFCPACHSSTVNYQQT